MRQLSLHVTKGRLSWRRFYTDFLGLDVCVGEGGGGHASYVVVTVQVVHGIIVKYLEELDIRCLKWIVTVHNYSQHNDNRQNITQLNDIRVKMVSSGIVNGMPSFTI